jgi:hypothetical protein
MNGHQETVIDGESRDVITVNGKDLSTVNRFDEYKGDTPTWEELEATVKRF